MKKSTIIRAATTLCLAAMVAFPLAARADEAPSPGVMEAISIAVEAYIYGYPLVTFDMVRKQQTNVATPDAEHAPMGQLIKMRTYPAVDNHCCAAPNADTLYTDGLAGRFQRALGLQHSRHGRPVLHHADAGRLLGGVQGGKLAHDGRQAPDLRHHRAGLVGHAPARRDASQIAHRDGVDPRAHLQHRHARGLQGGACPAGQVLGRSAQRLRQAVHAAAGRRRCQLRHEDGGAQAGQRPGHRYLFQPPRETDEDQPADRAGCADRSAHGQDRIGSGAGLRPEQARVPGPGGDQDRPQAGAPGNGHDT